MFLKLLTTAQACPHGSRARVSAMKKVIYSGEFSAKRRDMLKFGLPVLGLGLGLTLGGLAPLADAWAAQPLLHQKKSLVVYFSRTGNTKAVAGHVVKAVGADVFAIETMSPYPDEYRKTTEQAKKELESGFRPPLQTRIADMSQYGVVFVGSPCWWGTIATPVMTFFESYDFSGKTLAPFMTHEGSGLGRSVAQIKELAPSATVTSGLALRGRAAQGSQKDVAEWLGKLNIA